MKESIFRKSSLAGEPEALDECLPEKLLAERREIREHMRGASAFSEAEKNACIQLLPGYMEADGFFFAKFRRKLQ